MSKRVEIKAGDKFNKLTAVHEVIEEKRNGIKWAFDCECGNQIIVIASSVIRGKPKSCGCKKPIQAGDKFNKLTAVQEVERNKHNQIMWLFDCECGGTVITPPWNVSKGWHKSCGCIKPLQIGDKFNKLTAISFAGENKHHQSLWKFYCDCGTEIILRASDVKIGDRIHCGRCFANQARGVVPNNQVCTKCLIEKPKESFPFRTSSPTPGKRFSHCFQCQNGHIRNKINKNPCLKIRSRLSVSIHKALKNNGSSKKRKSSWKCLPYTKEDLKIHLENLFETWMTWENWGKYDPKTWNDNDQSTWKWQLDHIIPHSFFHYTSMNEQSFLDCWALRNLRPYSAKQNIIDGARSR